MTEAVTIVTEMESVLAWLRAELPGSTFGLQNVPEQPAANSFVVRFQQDNREVATASTMVVNREYQVIGFDDNDAALLTRMDEISRKCLYGRLIIPITDDSTRYIRVGSFSFGQLLRTEHSDTMRACVGVLTCEIREARDAEQYDKIMELHAAINRD